MTIKIHAITSMLEHVLCGNLNLHHWTRVTCFTENELSFISFEANAVFYYNSLHIYDLGAKIDFLDTNGFKLFSEWTLLLAMLMDRWQTER